MNRKQKETTKMKPKNETKILVFHGFNSNAASDTGKALIAKFGRERVITTSYDYIIPDIAEIQLDTLVNAHLTTNRILLVGTSLGGFWANYFSEKYYLPCVLINPSLNPVESMTKHIGEHKNFYTGEKRTLETEHVWGYAKYNVPNITGIAKTVLIGTQDAVVDFNHTLYVLRNNHIIMDEAEGHRISDKQKIVDIVADALFDAELRF